jgi:PIN domain nuclease of toxin-antitoxin system
MNYWKTGEGKRLERAKMFKYVIDSSALLAVIFNEPGAERIEPLYEYSFISAVNYTESLTKLVQKGYDFENAKKHLSTVVSNIVDFKFEIAPTAAWLDATTSKFGLSLGDRACLATAMNSNCEVLTTEKIWSKLTLPVKIHYMR